MRKYLKNRERILMHLSKFKGDVDRFNAPYYITQEGIAEAVGIGRNNIPREIKKLIDEGFVMVKKARVSGFKNRRTVYFLTGKGAVEVKKIKETLYKLNVKVIDFLGEVKTLSFNEISDVYGVDFITAAINLNRDLTLDLVRLSRNRGRRVHYIEENFAVKRFYGRQKEIQEMVQWLSSDKKILVINGLPGIGKTTLLLKFVKDHLKDRDVFFIMLEEYKNVVDVVYQLSQFFSKLGHPKLEKYLRTHGRMVDFEININNVLSIIKETCKDEVLIFDSVENARPPVRAFIQKIIENLSGKDCRIIIAGVGANKLIRLTMLGKIYDIYLSELSDEAAFQMLRDEGVPDDVSFKIISKYGGVPIILELARSGDPKNIRKFLFESVLNNLSKEERRAVEFASVFRRSFKMNALLLNNVEYSVIYSLINKNIFKEMEYEIFSLHRMLKNFIYDRLPLSKKKGYHIIAARYFLDEGEVLEAVYHYIKGGKYLRANMLLAENYKNYLFTKGGEIKELATAILNSYADVTDDHEWLLYGIIADADKISGEWNNAVKNYEKAMELSYGKDPDFTATVAWKLAEIYGKQGNAEKGLEVIKKALKYESRIRDRKKLSRVYSIMGHLYLQYGNYDDAQIAFMKALEIGEAKYDPEIIGYAYLGLGTLFHTIGDYESALSNFMKANEIFKEMDEESIGAFYAVLNIGTTYYEMFDSKAEKYLKEAIKIGERLGDKWCLVSAYLNYTNWLMYTNKYTLAKKYLTKAEEIAKEMRAQERLFYIYLSWGSYYSAMDKPEDSKKYFDMAIELAATMRSDNFVVLAAQQAIEDLKKYSYIDMKKYEKIVNGELKVVSFAKL